MASNNSTVTLTHPSLRQRLLRDIEDLQDKPYPGIALHIHDDDLIEGCLVLSPEGEPPMHMTITFGPRYPLQPPMIKMDSNVMHPNVFDGYICASILNTAQGYTPAYTLKGVFIQMLSFFSSDNIEQEDGYIISLEEWKKRIEDSIAHHASSNPGMLINTVDRFECKKCGFGLPKVEEEAADMPATESGVLEPATAPTPASPDQGTNKSIDPTNEKGDKKQQDGEEEKEPLELVKLPDDILLAFCDFLDDEDLFLAARAWNGFGRLIREHNILRTRELQCFTLKRGFNDLNLGIGVHVTNRPRLIKSEFDLISRDAYDQHRVRRSTQGLRFQYWLPLPIAENHWERVRKDIDEHLNGIAREAGIQGTLDTVIYAFMNEIVVQLSADAEKSESSKPRRVDPYGYQYEEEPKSTLTHASEKAIESYFQLFHLLLCLATDKDHANIAAHANSMIKKFIEGQTDKQAVPNLGHLLIMILISEVDVSKELTKALIKEAVTRNVVWMLEPGKGKNMPELSYMESEPVSDYRLQKSFEAGKTSYRLFMFLNLMRSIVNQARTYKDQNGNEHKHDLAGLRKELFKRHGAPPNGAAESMAKKIRDIQNINSFPEFLINMGMPPPSKTNFTTFLRSTVEASMRNGYSKWALTQEAALHLRMQKDPSVTVPEAMSPRPFAGGSHFSFFPGDNRGGGGRGGRGDFGSRGAGRGGSRGGFRGRGRGRGGY